MFGSTKELISKAKNWEKRPILEVAEVVLVEYNLSDNQYQQISQALYTFTLNRSYAYLLNVEPSNLVLLKTCSRDSDTIIIIFTNENGRPLGIEEKVNLTMLIHK